MKKQIFYFFLIVLYFSANAQGQEFRNFKKIENSYISFVIPLDCEFKKKRNRSR